mmetsp:Transcript_23755/g.43867  ORF Transcript_23755/g.43867 Transcript_23755/m.43867 type:complete len:207 (-) Transcript_23755:41-661(-)
MPVPPRTTARARTSRRFAIRRAGAAFCCPRRLPPLPSTRLPRRHRYRHRHRPRPCRPRGIRPRTRTLPSPARARPARTGRRRPGRRRTRTRRTPRRGRRCPEGRKTTKSRRCRRSSPPWPRDPSHRSFLHLLPRNFSAGIAAAPSPCRPPRARRDILVLGPCRACRGIGRRRSGATRTTGRPRRTTRSRTRGRLLSGPILCHRCRH